MLFIVTIVVALTIILRKKNSAPKLAIMTIIYSTFFFASKDPFIGIPLYFYIMLLSIVVSINKYGLKVTAKTNRTVIFGFLLILTMAVQMVNLSIGINVTPTLLINESNTDTMNIISQLKIPTLNFNVIKHFVFFVLYLLFTYVNLDVFESEYFANNFKDKMLKCCYFIFIGMTIEFIFVNITHINTVPFMEKIFSFTSNAGYNYAGFFNLTTVSFCAVERSGFAGVATIYFMLILKNKFDLKNVLMTVLCVACTFFSGSSSAIVSTLIFLIILLAKEMVKSKNGLMQMTSLLFLCIVCFFVISNGNYLFSKVNDYLNQTANWGSAYFRSQANLYGIQAFKASPLIGLGIGTNYSHSALIQVLSNIGILGALFTLLFHLSLIKIKLNFENVLIIIALIGIYWNSGLLQSFTSPHLLFFFLCLDNKIMIDNVKKI